MTEVDERAAFARLVLALRPYLGDVVLIGGWAHRLFRLHPLSQLLDFSPLLTQDVDLAIRADAPARRSDLRELLLQAGFTERFVGDDRPPVTRYELGEEGTFYAEFLTPLTGGGTRRSGGTEVTQNVAGISAQKLRHLEILLVAPWSVIVSQREFPVGARALEVRITNATSYLSQKLLIFTRRDQADRAKDVLYIHDTLITFGRSLSSLKEIWLKNVSPPLHPTAVRKLRGLPQALFARVIDATRDASRVARDTGRPISPEQISGVCREGLAQIFE